MAVQNVKELKAYQLAYDLIEKNNEVGHLLGSMLKNPSKWTLKN